MIGISVLDDIGHPKKSWTVNSWNIEGAFLQLYIGRDRTLYKVPEGWSITATSLEEPADDYKLFMSSQEFLPTKWFDDGAGGGMYRYNDKTREWNKIID